MSSTKVGQVGSEALWGSRHETHMKGGWEQVELFLQDDIAQGWCFVGCACAHTPQVVTGALQRIVGWP
jgi:hypothetical protein